MKFEKISIRNFRNFENIEIAISNKNIFFGLNDIGKTNFLYAMRYVFDKDIRKNGFLDSDFHKKNVETPIEITVTVDISDTDDSDSQKLRAQLKGAILSQHTKVFIKLVAKYNVQELVAMPILYWGGSLDHLYEIKQRGYRYDIDYIFKRIQLKLLLDEPRQTIYAFTQIRVAAGNIDLICTGEVVQHRRRSSTSSLSCSASQPG